MVGCYSEEEDEESIPNFLLHPLTATPSAISNANSHYQYKGGQRRPCSLQIHFHTCKMEGRLLYERPSNQLGQRERPAPLNRGMEEGGIFRRKRRGVEERDERRAENKVRSTKRTIYFSDESKEEDKMNNN
ncbi:hypothetical protein AMTRI_Chr07g79440 [Amborella trichopoda]